MFARGWRRRVEDEREGERGEKGFLKGEGVLGDRVQDLLCSDVCGGLSLTCSRPFL